ncbi:hypothetical protein JOC86_000894 [Bacillus pakistanensis]|uniref:Lipoprotein n=1 Tax=Rossellomorea pakistanensis TaxID=992288 RepID=A0ABS2N922_9BACI|nr:hypothetical protein [Bacillus pakistanensis]MBM7584357.1 hypothetical protein [Bacillus pakistanensis]
MKKKLLNALLLCLTASLLSGCLYPEENRTQNQVPYKDQLLTVQTAVEQFQKAEGGILPIKTRDESTPIYRKYPIDFKKIVPQYTAEIPGNAFENGGIFQYVLIDVEENPTVKLFDLRMAEKIREIKIRIKAQGYPPFKEEISKNVYTLNYKEIGYKEEPYVMSPYTNNNLPLLISGDGNIYVDYRPDLFQKIKEENLKPEQGEDIRNILVKDSEFVPAYSLPITVNKNNEPVFLMK